MTSSEDPLLRARALVLSDLQATGATDPETVSALEEAVSQRRWWSAQWQEGVAYAAGLVAQDVQDALLGSRGRWPLCPVCEDGTHALYIHPELGGPDPVWVCEQTAREVAPLGRLSGADAPPT
ncbi:MAG: hypothetical protein QOK15_3418 [Nocardioidaceae bacterium]|nr:hypothetical protein [Nocardioidaceae bacterium]